MKAISLWQPWATGIALGIKGPETRHWATSYRGELAIHAAKRWQDDQRLFAEQERALGTIGFGLPFGAIVAVVELVDVKRTEQLIDTISPVERRWGDYGPGRYGWIFRNIRELAQPVPAKGMQGLFTLTDDVAEMVFEQLRKSLVVPA